MLNRSLVGLLSRPCSEAIETQLSDSPVGDTEVSSFPPEAFQTDSPCVSRLLLCVSGTPVTNKVGLVGSLLGYHQLTGAGALRTTADSSPSTLSCCIAPALLSLSPHLALAFETETDARALHCQLLVPLRPVSAVEVHQTADGAGVWSCASYLCLPLSVPALWRATTATLSGPGTSPPSLTEIPHASTAPYALRCALAVILPPRVAVPPVRGA